MNGIFRKGLVATPTIDPASIAAGAQATTTVTVQGAKLGDFAMATAPYDLQAVGLHAYVSAANTVTILLKNGTAGAVDLASGVWTVKVFR